jgi:hypothetical protein
MEKVKEYRPRKMDANGQGVPRTRTKVTKTEMKEAGHSFLQAI